MIRPLPDPRILLAGLAGMVTAILLLWLYDASTGPWAWWNDRPFWYAEHLRMELPLILTVLLACAWPAGRGRLAWYLGGAAGAVPLVGSYVVIDQFSRAFNRPPSLSDLSLLPELVHADPVLGVGAGLAMLGLVAPPLVAGICWCRQRAWSERGWALLARGVLLVTLAAAFWSAPARAWWQDRVQFYNWSDLHCLKDFGHLSTCWQIAARTRDAHQRLRLMAVPSDAPRFPDGPVTRQRNVYIMLLESFVDPRDFAPPVPDAVAQELREAVPPDGAFDHLLSPVFGGFSAQAEFELMTGVPALAAAGPIDYQWFGDRPCDGPVASAAAAGYRTILVYGAGDEFFNAPKAHAALGFRERHYGNRDPWGIRSPADIFITDADLTTAVLDRLHQDGDHRPTFTLIVGMEGHERDGSTFPRDRSRFPDVVTCPDRVANELANLFHWRGRALARLITRLRRDDPEAILLVMGDHQPAALAGVATTIGTYAVPALMLVGGERIPIAGLHMYELPWLLWNHLDGNAARRPDDAALRRRYEAIIGNQLRD